MHTHLSAPSVTGQCPPRSPLAASAAQEMVHATQVPALPGVRASLLPQPLSHVASALLPPSVQPLAHVKSPHVTFVRQLLWSHTPLTVLHVLDGVQVHPMSPGVQPPPLDDDDDV